MGFMFGGGCCVEWYFDCRWWMCKRCGFGNKKFSGVGFWC